MNSVTAIPLDSSARPSALELGVTERRVRSGTGGPMKIGLLLSLSLHLGALYGLGSILRYEIWLKAGAHSLADHSGGVAGSRRAEQMTSLYTGSISVEMIPAGEFPSSAAPSAPAEPQIEPELSVVPREIIAPQEREPTLLKSSLSLKPKALPDRRPPLAPPSSDTQAVSSHTASLSTPLSSTSAGTVTGAGGQGERGAGGDTIGIDFGPKPPYPAAARRAGFEGRVLLSVLVGINGEPKEVQLLESSGREDCDQSALRTVRNRWRFARAEHAVTDAVHTVAVRYELRG